MGSTKSPSGSLGIPESSATPISVPWFPSPCCASTCLGHSTIIWLLVYILKDNTPSSQGVYLQLGMSAVPSSVLSTALSSWHLLDDEVCDRASGSHVHVSFPTLVVFAMKIHLVQGGVFQDTVSGYQAICEHLDSAAVLWVGKGKPIPELCVSLYQ